MLNFSSDTKKRVLSAIALILLVVIVLCMGKATTQCFAFLVWGPLITDEILKNFLKLERNKSEYKFSMILYLIFVALYFSIQSPVFSRLMIFLNIIQNIYLLFFLFKMRTVTLKLFRTLKDQQYLTSLFVFLPIHSMVYLLDFDQWVGVLLGFILCVCMTDILAWFIGKNFGKKKLWPSVSPKKTFEGALGSLIFTPIVMGFYWFFIFEDLKWYYFIVFALLSLFTILGDLVQSKIKRRFALKDSSSLIPGHGGVYDRSDSLLFVAPLYCLFISLVI